ncbi:MAG: MBL fold metallo-hydrolase [Dehalococcoidia bacterium]|nr:MBL fold metallo-hydrolase [Dehalococcoidia bacterium]
MKVSASVRAVQVPDDNPMHPQYTTIYLVGDEQVLSIDSGEAIDRYRWMLRGYLAATERAEIASAAITHHHADHSGNLKWAVESLDADVLVARKAVPYLKGRLPGKRREYLEPERPLQLEGGPSVYVLETPGHSPDSLCYYIEDEGVLFSGDTMLGSTTTTVHDLGAYMQTLQRLLELPNLQVICPGHGPLIHDPRERIQSYIDHRSNRERQILDVLERRGAVTSWDIMLELYPDIDTRLRRAADNNVRSHLQKLEDEDRLAVYDGVPRKKRGPTKRAVEHAKQRAEVIRKAKRYEAEDRRAEIRAQENPPNEDWKVPPKFELRGRSTD